MYKKILITIVISLLLSILMAPLRSGYFVFFTLKFSAVVGFFVFGVLTYLVCRKYTGKLRPLFVLASVLLGMSMLRLPFHLMNWEGTLTSLLEYLITLSGSFAGYMFYKTRGSLHIGVSIVCVCAAIWLSTTGYDYWIQRATGDNFTGIVADAPFYDLSFQNAGGDTLRLTDFRGKYLFLDCWYTYCGVCYRQFPHVQKLYDQYKDSDDILFYSLHSRMERSDIFETFSTGSNILTEHGYTFPCLSIPIDDAILKDEIGITAYPAILIFNTEEILVYKGRLEGASRYLSKI